VVKLMAAAAAPAVRVVDVAAGSCYWLLATGNGKGGFMLEG